MAHHKAAHSHDIDAHKDFQVVDSKSVGVRDGALRLKEQSHQIEISKSETSAENEPQGFEIAGFPWQFVLVMGVIAMGVLGMIFRLFGVF